MNLIIFVIMKILQFWKKTTLFVFSVKKVKESPLIKLLFANKYFELI